MAEENNTAPATTVAAPVETPAVKKTRAPRQKKAVDAPTDVSSQAAAAPAESVKAAMGRGRKAKAVVAKPDAAAKATRAKRTPKAVVQPQSTPVAVLDEIEDLIKLEEENQRLRKLLAEKLRNENADLRRRLDRV
ncbi:transcriptional regulator [Rhizobium sophorae]|uniref:Transcriptional regulator n=1 Tax=Rhizobium sophorae TaxID=1535242 RepID=A0A7Y3S8I9_9HYPH|nr:transcriptional regulator [Rhizobium sophorae]NNU38596.1 transcriptional regulator [Rhizobium sophorae]